MKFPSIQQILQHAVRTFKRFPLVLINAMVGTIAVVILVDHEGPPQATFLFNIMMAAILGIPLLTGFALLAEKQKWNRWIALGWQIFGLVLLVGYGFLIPSDLWEAPAIHILRTILIAIGLHLFVSFAPFTAAGETNGFWHYNKILLLRVIITTVYITVLYAGLALALAALDNLFGMNVPGKRYAELWFMILGVCATWTFLAGIPEKLDQLEAATDYPKGIKIFAQYILLPLVLVYLLILYAYLTKILIAWDWPQGWVGRLILGFATTGIFSILLLYPVRNLTENVWIRTAGRWFYVVMIPLVIMLLLALWRRISEYGITESRYIGIALGIWLGGIVLYFVLSRVKSIKAIPVSMSILALIISFGPWSAFSVSEKSQVDRLQEFLTKNTILVDGRIQKASATIPQHDAQQISSILAYLHDIHGYSRIQSWFAESLTEDSTGEQLHCKEPALVAKLMGIEFVNVWYSGSSNEIWLRSNQSEVINVQGYDRMIRQQHISVNQENRQYHDSHFYYWVYPKIDTITFVFTADGMSPDSLTVELNPLFNQLFTEYGKANVDNIQSEKMMLAAENPNLKIKIYFRYIRLHREENLIKPAAYGMDILYKIDKICSE
jgi:hypothetical protein